MWWRFETHFKSRSSLSTIKNIQERLYFQRKKLRPRQIKLVCFPISGLREVGLEHLPQLQLFFLKPQCSHVKNGNNKSYVIEEKQDELR